MLNPTYKNKSNCIQPTFESKEESKIESKSENHDYEHKQNQEQEYEFVSNDLFVQEIDNKLLNEFLASILTVKIDKLSGLSVNHVIFLNPSGSH